MAQIPGAEAFVRMLQLHGVKHGARRRRLPAAPGSERAGERMDCVTGW